MIQGRKCREVGWGYVDCGNYPDTPQEVEMEVQQEHRASLLLRLQPVVCGTLHVGKPKKKAAARDR